MKKFKLIFTLLALIVLVPSCENDGGDSKLTLLEGAVPNIQKVGTTDSFINLIAVNSGSGISLGFTVDEGRGDVASMDVVLFYKKGSGEVYKGTLATAVTTFPSTYTITQEDIYATFDEVNDASDFEIGDQLIVTADITLDDGRVIKLLTDEGVPNFGANVSTTAAFTVLQTYNVACPSDLGGSYTVSTTATSTDPGPSASENPISNFPYTVTITDNGGGNYSVSDAFGGVYILWYDIYGLDFEVEGTFDDVCGVISGTFPEPFGTDVVFDGTVNPENGVITIHWINGYDDEGTSVYTPVD